MADFIQQLSDQLDKDQPRWYTEWATSSELERFSEESLLKIDGDHYTAVTRVQHARKQLRDRVARRLLPRILNAALSAGIIKEP